MKYILRLALPAEKYTQWTCGANAKQHRPTISPIIRTRLPVPYMIGGVGGRLVCHERKVWPNWFSMNRRSFHGGQHGLWVLFEIRHAGVTYH